MFSNLMCEIPARYADVVTCPNQLGIWTCLFFFFKAVLVRLINANLCNAETLKSQWLCTIILFFTCITFCCGLFCFYLFYGFLCFSFKFYSISLLVWNLHLESITLKVVTAGAKGDGRGKQVWPSLLFLIHWSKLVAWPNPPARQTRNEEHSTWKWRELKYLCSGVQKQQRDSWCMNLYECEKKIQRSSAYWEAFLHLFFFKT